MSARSLAGRALIGALVGALVAALGACGEPAAPPPPPADPEPPPLAPVTVERLAALEATVPFAGGLAEPDSDLARRTASLVESVAYSRDARLRRLGLDELKGLGDDAAAPLRDVALAVERADAERAAALEALGALDSQAAALALVGVLETGRPAWVRARAAWHLGGVAEDRTVCALIKCLKYEGDEETAIWIAWALGALQNLSGLDALTVVRGRASAEALWPSIDGILAEWTERYGTDVDGLRALWHGPPTEALSPARSDAWRLEVWRWIFRLDEFQLRGVDDARFIFSQLGPAAVPLLAETLRDESRYRRLHAAQGLERMGARARGAVPALIAGLNRPDLAPQAARSLGAIGGEGVRAALVDRLAPHRDPGLRVAAARALGALGEPAAAPALIRIVEREVDSFTELDQAAAESLAHLGEGDRVAALLLALRAHPAVEPSTSQNALLAWLDGRAAAGDAAAGALAARLRAGEDAWDAVHDLAPSTPDLGALRALGS